MLPALHQQKCRACEGDVPPLSRDESQRLLTDLSPDWQMDDEARQLSASYSFRNFHEVMAFCNALAFIAHQENHHPDMHLSYRSCVVYWTTHAAQGLTLNDFICAAKTDALCRRATTDESDK